MNDVVHEGISEILKSTELTPVPCEQDPDAYGGALNGKELAVSTVAACEKAVEAALEPHYKAVDQLEMMAKEARTTVDRLAANLRSFSKGFTGHMSDFFVYAQQASDRAAADVKEFEEKISKMRYPRAGDD